MPEDVNRVVLVDFENDCIGTSMRVVYAFRDKYGTSFMPPAGDCIGPGKHKVWGVRFDTSNLLRDKSVTPLSDESLGVCPELCWKARQVFDHNHMQNLKIVVSGGFNEEKISKFIKLDVPVDVFAVGSSLFEGNFDFTADIVINNETPCAKIGREFKHNTKLQTVI
jgi:nicotinate phosphoribosyltransferase